MGPTGVFKFPKALGMRINHGGVTDPTLESGQTVTNISFLAIAALTAAYGAAGWLPVTLQFSLQLCFLKPLALWWITPPLVS